MVLRNKALFLLSLVFILLPNLLFSATLNISTDKNLYNVGESVYLTVSVSSKDLLNAVSSSLSIPKNLSIESVSKSGSVLNFWVTEPKIDRNKNLVTFEGVALSGTGSGNIITIRLKTLTEGDVLFSFNNAEILANDGLGTNITEGSKNHSISIKKSDPVTVEIKKDIIPNKVEIEKPKLGTLNVPEIKYINFDGNPAIEGNSNYKRSDVLLTFVSDKSSKIFISGITDGDGDFIINVPSVLRYGSYSVSAVIIDQIGQKSSPSNIISVNLGSQFCGDFINCDINNKTLLYTFISILLISIITILYLIFVYRHKNNFISIKREADEAEELVHKSFHLLKNNVSNKKSKDLKNDLDEAEDLILKEIEDIKRVSKNKK